MKFESIESYVLGRLELLEKHEHELNTRVDDLMKECNECYAEIYFLLNLIGYTLDGDNSRYSLSEWKSYNKENYTKINKLRKKYGFTDDDDRTE